MKKKYMFIALIVLALLPANAQTNINFDATSFSPDPAGTGLAFMNVANLPAPDGDGAFQFGSGWGIADLIAILDTGSNTVTLKPNRIGDPAEYWQGDGTQLRGNKIMDANHYIEDATLNGTSFTFNASVVSNTLNNTGIAPYDFSFTAFIKVFAADFSSVLASDIIDLRSTSGDFTLTMDATGFTSGEHIQYGFQMIGPNINLDMSFDAAYDNLGSIVVAPATLNVEEFSTNEFSVFPNPTASSWMVKATQDISSIQVFDVLGKQVLTMKTSGNNVEIDASNLISGVYFAKISSDKGTKTIKLIKR
ncbi:T9SS type A sorting domain-containing protein [Psychroserpens sp. SPM9]|uniref:T9SS type A sorting domain-containing protein n=1 Tax=Psychroserpens sp. SPM9 TaxID=2975598 RepID=UPI0021A8FAB7|nr:T9SS type A sorting domain-containing protein [Psychroserpens sp. SPM9]MDG5491348.1 T9SS type A sorting domain-containing protein [Psychroserpens sp. SPM9]